MLKRSMLALVVIAGVLHAQDEGPRAPSPLHIFAGAAIPLSSKNYDAGPLLGISSDVQFRNSLLGVRLEGSYASFSAGSVSRPIATITSSAVLSVERTSELGFNANGVLWSSYIPVLVVRPYIDGGGSYSRLNDYANSNSVTYAHMGNYFGFNGGGGFDFRISQFSARVDGRYKQIAVDGTQFKTTLVSLGVRF